MYSYCSQDFKKVLYDKVRLKSFVENSEKTANTKEINQGYILFANCCFILFILLLMNNVLEKMFLNVFSFCERE